MGFRLLILYVLQSEIPKTQDPASVLWSLKKDPWIAMQKLILQLPWTELPAMYTCDGGDISPPLRIEGLLKEVRSLVVMVYHPHESGCCSFCAWIIWNIPPVDVIPEGIPPRTEVSLPVRGVQGLNDYGRVGYMC
jgi:hypothetical protein